MSGPPLPRLLPMLSLSLMVGCASVDGPETSVSPSDNQVPRFQALDIPTFRQLPQWVPPANIHDVECDGFAMDAGGVVSDDIDGDGHLDLVFARNGFSQAIRWGSGDGRFERDALGEAFPHAGV